MTTYIPPKKGVELIFYASLVSQSTGQWQANPTLAAGDVKVATDDGAPANIATLPAVDADFTKRIKVTLSATEMNGDNVTVIFSDAAGAEWDDVTVNIQTSANQIDDLSARLPAALSNDGFMKSDLQSILEAVFTEGAAGRIAAAFQQWFNVPSPTGTVNSLPIAPSGSNGGVPVIGTGTNNFKSDASARVTADTDRWAGTVIPAPSVTGVPKVDLTQIDGLATNGNNATLGLKYLTIYNTTGRAIDVRSDADDAAYFNSTAPGFAGLVASGPFAGFEGLSSNGAGFHGEGTDNNAHGANFVGFGTGKSINVPNNIAVSDGNLTLAAIASAVWANATRTLTSFGTLVADVWALAIETGYTAKQSMRLMLSALAGKISGAATTNVLIRDVTDTKTRIDATVDSSGNRTAVTHDTTD